MILRRDAAGVLAVGQPAHALMCGSFARAWGNARFDAVVPLDATVLGAEQHDAGWAAEDLAPHLDPDAGLPRDFMHMPLPEAAALWRDGPARLVSQSRWAALLAALHGRRLYGRLDLTGRPAADVTAVAELLDELDRLRDDLLTWLRADPATATDAAADVVARNHDLVWTWDTLSLALLLDWAPLTLEGVPATGGAGVDVQLRAVAPRDGTPTLSLAPWPFADPGGITVTAEGRRLTGRLGSRAELDAAWAAAPWETVAFSLVPAPSER